METIATRRFDIALVDINLRGARIDPVADRLSAIGIPFLFTTGYGEDARPKAHRHRPVITKPYSDAEVIDALLRPSSADGGVILMSAMPHVLIAEDETLVALAMAFVLESEGYRVTVACNGVEAVEADVDDPADILITDMRMPVMDGAALIRAIRERRPDLPIIVVSGFSEHLPRPEPGRLVVMRKPYEVTAMAPTITALLSGEAGSAS